jgi:hypothetical protein
MVGYLISLAPTRLINVGNLTNRSQNSVVDVQGTDKSLARPTSRCILFDVENISFNGSLVIYINSINISPIMIISRIYENQYLLSL